MTRWSPRIAFGLTVVGVLVGTFLLPVAEPVEPLFSRLNGFAFAVVGFLATRRPEGRRIGWLCLAVGLALVGFDVTAGYAETRGPGAVWAYWAGEWLSLVQPVLVMVVLPAVFPTGRSLGPRWRWLVPTAVLLLVVAMVSVATADDVYEVEAGPLGRNPLAAPGVDAATEWVFVVVALGALVCAVAAMTSLVLRFRRSRGVERLQLRWLLTGVVGLVGLVLLVVALGALAPVGVADGPLAESVIDGTFGMLLLVLPTSIGVALTRYRLYELDRLLSRTVAYSLLIALLAAVYLGLVVALGAAARALSGESGDLVVAVSTLAVAALFQPVRQRTQEFVDRRFNRARYDAARTVDAFGRELRDQLSLDAIVAALRSTASATVQPGSVGVVLSGGQQS